MLKTSKQLLEPSLPFLLTIPFSFSLFSLLNCKYQVPFILFCYYIVLVFFFFFSLVGRRSSGGTVYPQSQSVNTISFQSLVQEGKTEQNVSFLFSLPPFLSSLPPCSAINVVMTFIYCIMFVGFLGAFSFLATVVNLREYSFFLIPLFPVSCKISHPRYCTLIQMLRGCFKFQICVCVCTCKCPLNFNVKGMLQASGSMGIHGRGEHRSVCVC